MVYTVLSLTWQNTRNKVSFYGGCMELINSTVTGKPDQRSQRKLWGKQMNCEKSISGPENRVGRLAWADAAPDLQQAAKQGGMGKCWGLLVVLTGAIGGR